MIVAPIDDVTDANIHPFDANAASVLWWYYQQTQMYRPYIIQVVGQFGRMPTATLMAQFVDINTSTVISDKGPFAFDLADIRYVWPYLPSTLLDQNLQLEAFDEPNSRALIFLNEEWFTGDRKGLLASGGQGKWPRAASTQAVVRQVKSELTEILEDKGLEGITARRLSAIVNLLNDLDWVP